MTSQLPAIAYPSFWDALIFRAKASVFQLKRSFINTWIQPVQRYPVSHTERKAEQIILAESITPLWTSQTETERHLLAGKIQNLRVAVQSLNTLEIPEQGVFSFWAQVGHPSARKGYVAGREIRQGCLIPSVGGGLCQLSNALYSVALDVGLEILERHAHTQVIPASLAEIGRDATVFWNYVDLRFRADQTIRIEAFLTADQLVVRLVGKPAEIAPQTPVQSELRTTITDAHSCSTCGVTACFRNQTPLLQRSHTAYLLDEYWSEFDHYIQSQRSHSDMLAIPLSGKRWKKANYAWNEDGFKQVQTATGLTLKRSFASRNLPAQGQSRQSLLLNYDAKLAEVYAAKLTFDRTHVVTTQQLLPFLWQSGALGGRTFDVLMTRLPFSNLQQRLDQAFQQHGQSNTLADFRVDDALVEAEEQALKAARKIITPHTEIASLFPHRAVLLDWHLPTIPNLPKLGDSILFPASTLGRKGAYELREAAIALNLTLTILGTDLEGEKFWQDVITQRANGLEGVRLVVLPAYVEHRPRILLRAIASGIPVIASTACGLGNLPGVTTVPTGNSAALRDAIAKELGVLYDLTMPKR
jgi:hypothetical protein